VVKYGQETKEFSEIPGAKKFEESENDVRTEQDIERDIEAIEKEKKEYEKSMEFNEEPVNKKDDETEEFLDIF